MSNPEAAIGVLIGRFQPFHNGHLELLRRALEISERLLVLCGTDNCPRTIKNPFFFAEREQMISQCLSEAERERIFFAPIPDYPYQDSAWCLSIENRVQAVKQASNLEHLPTVLIGHEKDASSYYLHLFPKWKRVELEEFSDGISATPLRDAYLRKGEISEFFPLPVQDYLREFLKTDAYQILKAERLQIDKEKAIWKDAPYPPVFATVDAIVLHQNSILLIERGRYPGKGLWALPGGFLEEEETMLQSCLRELSEETSLPSNPEIWLDFLQGNKVFDAPHRSLRGRVITQVFLFVIPDDCERPVIRAADDAGAAFWLELKDLRADRFFDDHYHIIREMLHSSNTYCQGY